MREVHSGVSGVAGGVAVALAAVIHNDSVLIFVGAGTVSDARAREGETKKDRGRGRETQREREGGRERGSEHIGEQVKLPFDARIVLRII